MKKKLMKVLIVASVITVFASLTSFAAGITIDSLESVDTTTGDVKFNFTATDMAAADQVTALVYTPTAQNSGPVDTNIVYIDQNSNGTYSGVLAFKMKDGVAKGTDCTLLMGGTGVATAASKDFEYTDYTSGYNVSGTVSGVTIAETDPDFVEMMFGDKASTYGFTINLKNADQSEIIQTATVTYANNLFTYTFPEKVKAGNYVVQIYKPGYLVRVFPIIVGSENLVIEDKDLKYGDVETDCLVDSVDTGSVLLAAGTDIFGTEVNGKTYSDKYECNADALIDSVDTGAILLSASAGYDVFYYDEYSDENPVDIFDTVIE